MITISLRFWVNNKYAAEMLNMINSHYNTAFTLDNIKDNSTITNNIFLSLNKQFMWPSLENDYYDENGTCLALKNHIGVLVDGTIVPCCLDSCGIIKLGNIFTDSLDDVINSNRYQEMLNGFRNNFKKELLCRKCPIKKNIKG